MQTNDTHFVKWMREGGKRFSSILSVAGAAPIGNRRDSRAQACFCSTLSRAASPSTVSIRTTSSIPATTVAWGSTETDSQPSPFVIRGASRGPGLCEALIAFGGLKERKKLSCRVNVTGSERPQGEVTCQNVNTDTVEINLSNACEGHGKINGEWFPCGFHLASLP